MLPDVVVLVKVPGDGLGNLVGRELFRFGSAIVHFQVLGRHHISSFRRRKRLGRLSSGCRVANWLQIERGDSCYSTRLPRIDTDLSHLEE